MGPSPRLHEKRPWESPGVRVRDNTLTSRPDLHPYGHQFLLDLVPRVVTLGYEVVVPLKEC